MVPPLSFLFNDIDILKNQNQCFGEYLLVQTYLFSHDQIKIKHFCQEDYAGDIGSSQCASQEAQESLCLIIGNVKVDHSVKKTSASFLHHDGTSLTQ